MRLFTLLDARDFVIALFLGCLAALVLYLSFRYGHSRRNGADGETTPPLEEYPEGLGIGDNPVPPVLVFLCIGFAVWFVCYVVFFGILGGPV
jgi:hypothetical protein